MTTPNKTLPGWLILLGILTAVAPLSIDMYLPSFPQVEASLNAPPSSMGYTLASFFIGMTIGQLVYGPISDRFGRKPPLLFGFALYTAASMGCVMSDNLTALCLWRFLQGMGGCAGTGIPSAIIRDRLTVQDSARAFSMLMLIMGLAPILAPMAGGWILTIWTWRAIFVLLTIFGALCIGAILFALSESHDIAHAQPLNLQRIIDNYTQLLTDRHFLGFALARALTMSGLFAYIAGSPFVFINLFNLPTQHYAWLFGFNAFGLIASSQFNAWALRKFHATFILRWALWVPPSAGLALVVLAYSNSQSFIGFVLGSFCFVASLGWIAPNATAAALATRGQLAGTAAGLASAIQFLLATLGSAAVGLFSNGTSQPFALTMFVCGGAAWLSHRLLVRVKT
jgi:DHA1 family bicyclomycin/chloramphenicol resistance-like MFS transporter